MIHGLSCFSLHPWPSPLPRAPLPPVSSAAAVFAGDVPHQEGGLTPSLPPLQSCFCWWDGGSPTRSGCRAGPGSPSLMYDLAELLLPNNSCTVPLAIARIKRQVSEVFEDVQTFSRPKRYPSALSLTQISLKKSSVETQNHRTEGVTLVPCQTWLGRVSGPAGVSAKQHGT